LVILIVIASRLPSVGLEDRVNGRLGPSSITAPVESWNCPWPVSKVRPW
jgi:hypothetical protein